MIFVRTFYLIEKYKQMIEAQNSLITKSIVKSTNLKENKENYDKNMKKEKILDDLEYLSKYIKIILYLILIFTKLKDALVHFIFRIENSRKFLLEQKAFLEQKNKEMVIFSMIKMFIVFFLEFYSSLLNKLF